MMYSRLALWIIRKTIYSGEITITLQGIKHCLKADRDGSKIAVTLSHPHHLTRIITNPELAIGELYMSGDLRIDDGNLELFIHWLMLQKPLTTTHWFFRLLSYFSRWADLIFSGNSKKAAKQNVAHHYDLTDALFDSFLDPWRQYSCAYFNTPESTLEQAQKTKLARIGAKLNIEDAQSVLDIGGGWGGLSFALAQMNSKVQIKAITVSENQHRVMTEMLKAESMAHQITCHIQDYRDEQGSFDRIVSVGMLEHVGKQHLFEYFDMVSRCLNENGVALIHAIGRFGPSAPTNKWLKKYIFPGGYLPALSEIMSAVEQTDLKILDMEILRLHYADTLKSWRQSFHENRHELGAEYDDRFVRMWDFYLVSCEYYFRLAHGMVFQIQLGRDQNAVPRHRRYIGEDEERFKTCLKNSPDFGK